MVGITGEKITISIDRTMAIAFIIGLICGYLLHRWVSERLYYNVPEYWNPNYWGSYSHTPSNPMRFSRSQRKASVEEPEEADQYGEYTL